jgi:hypothetical protein
VGAFPDRSTRGDQRESRQGLLIGGYPSTERHGVGLNNLYNLHLVETTWWWGAVRLGTWSRDSDQGFVGFSRELHGRALLNARTNVRWWGTSIT